MLVSSRYKCIVNVWVWTKFAHECESLTLALALFVERVGAVLFGLMFFFCVHILHECTHVLVQLFYKVLLCVSYVCIPNC